MVGTVVTSELSGGSGSGRRDGGKLSAEGSGYGLFRSEGLSSESDELVRRVGLLLPGERPKERPETGGAVFQTTALYPLCHSSSRISSDGRRSPLVQLMHPPRARARPPTGVPLIYEGRGLRR